MDVSRKWRSRPAAVALRAPWSPRCQARSGLVRGTRCLQDPRYGGSPGKADGRVGLGGAAQAPHRPVRAQLTHTVPQVTDPATP